ncbi:MAG TPA: PAS domain S-box protein [Thermoanaerobaculia bacterium]|nr:PAS domain S-box protein [Thermoanaerobaculia bacterium]
MVKIPIVDQVMSLVRKSGDVGGRRVVGREDRLRTGFDQAPIGVAFATADGQWLYVNDRFLTAVGYSRADLGRISFASITHEDDAKKETALLRRLVQSDIESYRIEKRVMAKNGRYRTIEVLVAIARANGKFTHLIYIIDEPQPSKRHEPVRESERLLLQVLDDLQDVAVVRTDDRGTITGWNTGATRIFGYSRDEILGKNRRVLYRDTDSWDGRSTTVMKNVAESGRMEMEDWRVTRDGKHLWVKTVMTPFRMEGVVRGYIESITPPPPVQRDLDSAQVERLKAELDKERRTGETLRSALDEFGVASEETMNELRIITAALRKEMERRKMLEDELRQLNEKLAAVPEPEPELLVEEEIIDIEIPAEIVWQPVGDAASILRERANAQASGTLLFRTEERRKEFFFEKGRVFSCASNDPAKFLAQRLLEQGTITEEDRRRALEIKKETDLPLGRILLILGAVTEEQLVEEMRAKVEAEVTELLDWFNAEWAFDEGNAPSLKLVPLRIEVDELLNKIRREAVEVVIVSTKSRKMHRETCISARRVSTIALRVFYGGEAEAEAAGYERCRQCFR